MKAVNERVKNQVEKKTKVNLIKQAGAYMNYQIQNDKVGTNVYWPVHKQTGLQVRYPVLKGIEND